MSLFHHLSNVRDRELLYFYANALNDSNNFGTDDIVDFIFIICRDYNLDVGNNLSS